MSEVGDKKHEVLLDVQDGGRYREYLGLDEKNDKFWHRVEHDVTDYLELQKDKQKDKSNSWWTDRNGKELCDIPYGIYIEWKTKHGFDALEKPLDKAKLMQLLNGDYNYLLASK